MFVKAAESSLKGCGDLGQTLTALAV
jgi:hypothetical protein